MRTLKALLAIVTGTIVAMATADAKAEWQTVYQTDFSTDPGWTTDQPNNFYWDSTNQQYFLSMTNQKQAYTPSRYTYTNTTYGGGSFNLEWDQEMTRSDWSGGVNFGLYASDLNGGFADAGLPPGNGTVNLEYANPDAGHMLILRATDASGTFVMDYAAGNYYSLNTWYHNLIEYDSTTGVITATVTDMTTDNVIQELSVSGLGALSVDMTRLGGSRYPFGEDGAPGANPSAIADAVIDNVVLSEAVPESSTFVMWATGAIGLLAHAWRKRRVR